MLTVENDQTGDRQDNVTRITLSPANCWIVSTKSETLSALGSPIVDCFIKRAFEVWRNQTRMGVDVFQIVFTPDNLWDIQSVSPGKVSVSLQGFTGTFQYKDGTGTTQTAHMVNGVMQSPT